MPYNFKFRRVVKIISTIFISAILISIICLFEFEHISFTKAGELDAVSGWLWSYNAGWVSLNSINCINWDLIAPGTCNINGIDYGVNVTANGEVTGEAWSENVGWVCFGETCAEAVWGGTNAPDGSSASASFDGVKFSGWAKILSFNDEGWIKLQGPATSSAGKTGASCLNCYYKEGTKCKACFTETSSDYGLVGDVCYECAECATSSLPYICNNCDTNCNRYGLVVDTKSKEIFGWAWGGFDNDKGVGWLKADHDFGTLYSPFSWLETKYGNVYSKDSVLGKSAPIGRYNATYCVQTTGAITNFKTSSGCKMSGFEEINFPNQSNLYTNVLGKIDRTGILSGAYGEVITIEQQKKTEFKRADLISNFLSSCKLDGKIYHIKGNLTIDNTDLNFCNASTGSNGSGLIIIDGNLNINVNLTYDTSSITRIKQLASVGWIVKGNLIFDPNVEEVVGAFYVEGNDGVADNAAVYTGESESKLTIYGLVIAPEYSFERIYVSLSEGSEQIIYDGRALVNTPPGMEDLTKALPLWRESAP